VVLTSACFGRVVTTVCLVFREVAAGGGGRLRINQFTINVRVESETAKRYTACTEIYSRSVPRERVKITNNMFDGGSNNLVILKNVDAK